MVSWTSYSKKYIAIVCHILFLLTWIDSPNVFYCMQVFVDLEWFLILVLAVLSKGSFGLKSWFRRNGETMTMQFYYQLTDCSCKSVVRYLSIHTSPGLYWCLTPPSHLWPQRSWSLLDMDDWHVRSKNLAMSDTRVKVELTSDFVARRKNRGCGAGKHSCHWLRCWFGAIFP